MTEIRIKNQGNLKIIPVIEKGGVVELSGINGIGKTKTATYLEILCNNYEFPDRKNFDFFRTGSDEITIEIDLDTGTIIGKLTPNFWRFDTKTKKIVPETIGKFYLNSTEIDYNTFKSTLNIKIIRGDESLETQVENISSFIQDRLRNETEVVEEFYNKILEYRTTFEEENRIPILIEYLENKKRITSLKKSIIENEKQHKKLEEDISTLENIMVLLNDLEYNYSHDKTRLESDFETLTRKIKDKEEQIKHLEKHITDITVKVQQEDKSKYLPIDDIKKRNRLEKKINKLKLEIQELDPKLFRDNASLDKSIVKIIEAQENQLNLTSERLKEIEKESADLLFLENKITQIHEISEEAIERFLGERIVFHVESDSGNARIPFNFNDLELATKQSLLDYLNSTEVKQIKEKVAEISGKRKIIGKIKEKSISLKNELEKLKKIEKKIADRFKEKTVDPKVKSYLDQIAKATERKKIIEEEKNQLNLERNNLKGILDTLKSKPNRDTLISSLQSLDYPIIEFLNDPDKTKDREQAFEEEIDKFARKIDDKVKDKIYLKKQIENLFSQLQELIQILDQQKNELTVIATHQGYTNIDKWISYTLEHRKRLNTLIDKLDMLYSKLQSINSNLMKIKQRTTSKIKKDDVTYQEAISEIFNEIFLELYNREVFFKHVFIEFDNMVRFDLRDLTIVFEKNGTERKRRLAEFSSGEKSFAYIRALMSIDESGARYRIIILDESNALLDHIKSDALLDYQKTLVNSGMILKFINILPAREKLEEKIAFLEKKMNEGDGSAQDELKAYMGYKESLNQNGYFQKILLK